MTIKTSRAEGSAQVTIDEALCNGCGSCVKVCRGAPLLLEGGKAKIGKAEDFPFGCIGCGHCVVVCPQGAIQVKGRDLYPQDIIPLPPTGERADYEHLQNLLLTRRSVRNFHRRSVEKEKINQILEAAATAPMGYPPSDVSVLVVPDAQRVRTLAFDILGWLKKYKRYITPLTFSLLRPFMKKEEADMMATFVLPALRIFIEQYEKGNDWLLYGAPLAMYFYPSVYSDPADAFIPATYAMLAAESLGLGTCMIGTVSFAFQYSKALRAKYNVPESSKSGLLVLFGYPAVQYHQAIHRRFARITGWNGGPAEVYD